MTLQMQVMDRNLSLFCLEARLSPSQLTSAYDRTHYSQPTSPYSRTERGEALEIRSQNLDEFVHILASCSPTFEQLGPGLSLSAFKEVMRIVEWVRPDWRKVADYF